MKLDQIAYAVYDDEEEARLKKALGLSDKEWVVDNVVAESHLFDPATGRKTIIGSQRAKLQFNYDLGIEVEVLRHDHIDDSFHRLSPLSEYPKSSEDIFISHQGFHLDDDEDFPTMEGFPLIQETWTISHTSDFLTNPESRGYRRRYHYRIHQLSPGTVVKFIKRVYPK